MKTYQVRKFRESDSEIVAKLMNLRLKTIIPFDKLNRQAMHSEYGNKELEEYHKGMKNGKVAVYVAEIGIKVIGEIVGEIHDGWVKKPVLWRKKELEGEIADLCVLPEHRGKGVAKSLIRKLEEWFKQKDCKTIIVGTEAANIAARKCYEKAGFLENEMIFGKKVV